MDVLERNQQLATDDRAAQAGNVGDHIHEQDCAKALPLWRWPTPRRASKAAGGGHPAPRVVRNNNRLAGLHHHQDSAEADAMRLSGQIHQRVGCHSRRLHRR